MIGLERQWGVRRLVRAGSGARGIRLAALFALAGAGGSSAIAQSYGLNEQVLVIGASEFRPIEEAPAAPMSNTDGYVYGSATSATDYSAPVTLPEGAEITMLCLYAYDADPGAVVGTEMHAFKLVPAGTDPGRIQVPGTFLNTSWDFGYGVVCSDPLSFTYRTTGDKRLDEPLSAIGGKGLFTRELESDLAKGVVDCCVHSLKDLPTEAPRGLTIAAVLEREDPRDVLIVNSIVGVTTLGDLPAGSSSTAGILKFTARIR